MSKITNVFRQTIDHIEDYSKKSPWKERFKAHFDNYLNLFAEATNLSQEQFLNKMQREYYELFGSLYGIAIETFVEMEFGEDNTNIIDEYLKRRGWKLSKTEINCLQEIKNRSFSIYEVIKVNPGESMIVEDFLLGTKQIRVWEKSGTKNAKPFDLIVSKVMKIEGEYYFTGTVFKLPHDSCEKIRKKVRKELKNQKLNLELYEIVTDELCPAVNSILRKYTSEIFVAGIKYLLLPPTILNFEGDEISFSKITIPVKNVEKVIEKLDFHPDMNRSGDDPPFWNLLGERKPSSKLTEITFTTSLDGNLLNLGDIELKGNRLECTANSEKRTKHLTKLLQDYLGELIGTPVIEHVDIYEEKENREEADSAEEIPEEIEKEIIKEMFDKHYRDILNQKIPALNNQTPRKCAKTNPERLIRWLIQLDERSKEQGYDSSWIWDELGLEKPKDS